jgi:hypothetical protein
MKIEKECIANMAIVRQIALDILKNTLPKLALPENAAAALTMTHF